MLADQPHTDASTNQSIHWPSGIAKTFREGAQGIAAAVVAAGVGGAMGGGTFAAAMGVSAAGSLAARAVIRRSRSTSPAPGSTGEAAGEKEFSIN